MPLQVDWFNKLVLVTSPTTNVTAQVLSDFIEDQMITPEGMASDGVNWDFKGDIARPDGKLEDPGNPGVFTQIILTINPDWQLQYWAGSGYTRFTGGKFIGGVGGEVMKATGTAGDITVLESQVDGTVVTTGSGLDAGQDAKLTAIDTRTLYHDQIINNYKEILKSGAVWSLIIYDDGEVSGGTEILRKALKDKDGNNISDLAAGVLAAELESTA